MVVAAGVTYLSINIWSYSQQWRIELPSIVTFNNRGRRQRAPHVRSCHLRHAAARPALLLLLCLSIAYARRKAQHPPALRIPRIGGLELIPAPIQAGSFNASRRWSFWACRSQRRRTSSESSLLAPRWGEQLLAHAHRQLPPTHLTAIVSSYTTWEAAVAQTRLR
jgi:hypothetical protein